MQHTQSAYATFLLRVSLGLIYLAHGAYLKLAVFGLDGTVGFFQSLGLPAVAAYGVIAAETFGGLALILGIGTRWVAPVLALVSLGATWVHLGNGWLFTNSGGGWEYPALLVTSTAALALLGDGAWSLRSLFSGSPQAEATA